MKNILAILIAASVIFSAGPSFSENKTLKIHFLDVGEGDSILIEAPGGKSVLIDTGNFITGYRINKYLDTRFVDSLEYLILTHPDLDHIGGAFTIVQAHDTNRICDNGQDIRGLTKNSDVYRWYKSLIRDDRRYSPLKKGDSFSLGVVDFRVIWPPSETGTQDFNKNSMVIMLEYGKFKALFMADANTEVEKALLQEGIELNADVLKIGHHGADDATSKEFLTVVAPKISVISVNANNKWGRPADKTIDVIKSSGSKVFRTDIDGDILLEVTQDGSFSVATEKAGL